MIVAVVTDNRDSFDRILGTALTRIDVPMPSFGCCHAYLVAISPLKRLNNMEQKG